MESPISTPVSHRRAVIAGLAGNVMEWYDFAVYGYFAQVIGQHFFPSEDPTSSLIASFGAFAAGFLMRPVGGLVFGHIGDRLGRKAALTLSVLAMAIPTFLIGLLPDHAQIGALAPILLVALRMIQGLSVGGEYTTSVVFLVEGAAPHRRGFAGSWSPFGAGAGILMGSAVGAVLNTVLSPEAVFAWGWRLPFLLGLGVGVAGLFIRRHIPDPQPHAESKPAGSPIREAFRSEWRTILRIMGFNLMFAVGFYMIFVYVATYLKEIVHVSARSALDINTLSMVIMLALVPLMGLLSDRIGRKPLLLGAALGLALFSWPLFWLMHHPDFYLMFLGQVGFAVFIGMLSGVAPAAMVESLPAHVRCTALSVGYNVTFGLIGGLTPMIAAYLIQCTGEDLAPAYFLILCAVISLGVIWTMRETVREPLR